MSGLLHRFDQTEIAAAALVGSLLAIAIAGWSLWYSSRQARAADEGVRASQRPRFKATLDGLGVQPVLELFLESDWPLRRGEVSILGDDDVVFVAKHGWRSRHVLHKELIPGQKADWNIDVPGEVSLLRLRVSSQGRRRRDRWVQLIEVEIPRVLIGDLAV